MVKVGQADFVLGLSYFSNNFAYMCYVYILNLHLYYFCQSRLDTLSMCIILLFPVYLPFTSMENTQGKKEQEQNRLNTCLENTFL